MRVRCPVIATGSYQQQGTQGTGGYQQQGSYQQLGTQGNGSQSTGSYQQQGTGGYQRGTGGYQQGTGVYQQGTQGTGKSVARPDHAKTCKACKARAPEQW
jgi:hypothetical protein